MNLVYRVEISPSARKYLSRVDKKTAQRIILRIRQLSGNPYAGDVKPLKGTKSTFRCRVGNFRIIFTIDKQIKFIAITTILPRGQVYK